MLETRTKLGENGRIIIPVYYRRALHLEQGEELIIRLEDGELRLFSLKQSLKKAQAIVRKYNKDKKSLSKMLFAMRKEEIGNE